jgi:hypothetical protein
VGVPLGTVPSHLRPSLVRDPWLGSDLFRCSLVRTLRREIGSFFQRIRWLLETEVYLRGVRLDFEGQLELTRQESRRAEDGYTEDSNNLSARFPWLTLVDARIFAEAWLRGAAWAYSNARSKSSSLEPMALTDLTDSTIVPESSKCDPSIPPPSQGWHEGSDEHDRSYTTSCRDQRRL